MQVINKIFLLSFFCSLCGRNIFLCGEGTKCLSCLEEIEEAKMVKLEEGYYCLNCLARRVISSILDGSNLEKKTRILMKNS